MKSRASRDGNYRTLTQSLVLHQDFTRTDLHWQPFREGIEVAWLYREGSDGPAAAYLRYSPGASVPRHHHPGYEHILVLEGAQQDENGIYAAGTLVVNPPGSRHAVYSATGCLVLAIWGQPVVFDTDGV